MKQKRVLNEALLRAGLDLMDQAGNPLSRVPTRGRSMIYAMESGETVRVRTCNDHVLVVLADRDEDSASLNVEGTDYLLLVMPEAPRTNGAVMAFLVPAQEAAEEARATHRAWRASNPNTKGDNRTWNLWFDDKAPSKSRGYARKWSKYRLTGSARTDGPPGQASIRRLEPARARSRVSKAVERAKQIVAEAACVPREAVRITLEL